MRISAEAVLAKNAVTKTDASAPANTDCNFMTTFSPPDETGYGVPMWQGSGIFRAYAVQSLFRD
jgi:hypothetical protein